MLLIGVLPRLGNAPVIPKDGSVVVPKLTLLHILGDGVVGFFGGHFHLGFGHFGDLDDGVVRALGLAVEGDVVPGRDGGIALVEGDAEGFCGSLAGCGGGVGMEDGGRADEAAGGAPCRGWGG